MVSHRERRIVVHRRMENQQWRSVVAVAKGSVMVETIGAELQVDTIYRGSSIA
ncbi:MAG: hypothetical protein KBG15_10855 [Kofleriaceae bacterium]|nr:hypothetical protein [Kofleriaceae bacterium]